MNTTRISRRPQRRAFTLVEILVVIGIIIVLAGILVPLVGRAMRQAKQTRTAADLQSITVAIEAFKTDHGFYPGAEPVIAPNTGAAILGRYLNGPLGDGYIPPAGPPAAPNDPADPPAYDGAKAYAAGDVVGSGANTWVALIPNTGVPTGDLKTWAPCNLLRDGADGPGFRMRDGGKKFGPYMDSGKVAMRGVAFIDGNGNPILYFLGNPAKLNFSSTATTAAQFVGRSSQAMPVGNKSAMKYDADDNFEPFRRAGETSDNTANATTNGSPLQRIRAMLGDYDNDGLIETNLGEKIVTEAPFLLWAAGTDGKFGPDADMTAPDNTLDVKDADRCDDVTNFRQ
jgi:type II secretory pathway pseudopilin PulG